MIRSILLAATLAFAALPALAVAQNAEPTAGPTANAIPKQDRDFIEDAAMGSLVEIQTAQVALRQAMTDDVKKLAQRLLDDHTKMNEKVRQVAQQKGITLPTDLDQKHRDHLTDLTKIPGVRFDREYVTDMVKDHEGDIKAFEKEVKDGKDAEIKELAVEALPTLREHLNLAKQAQDRLK